MSEVIKSAIQSLYGTPQSVGLDGTIWWPIHPLGLLQLYLNSPEHCRCVHVKAHGAYGQGLVFDRDADANRFESLCEAGSSSLFVDQGVDNEVFGNDWLEVVRDGRGNILQLNHLPAITMHLKLGGGHIQRLWEGASERIIQFTEKQAFHYRMPCPGGGFYSYPNWIGGAGMIDLAYSATEYNRKFFANSAVPEYTIITKGFELSDAQKVATREFFRSEFLGTDRSHRTLYLHLPEKENDIEFKRITAETKDADFIQLLDAARERIPVAHGVPPKVAGLTSTGMLIGSNEITAQSITFENYTLSPMRARRIVGMRGLFTELGIDWRTVNFPKTDITPQFDDNAKLTEWLGAGIITPDEARSMANIDYELSLRKSKTANTSELMELWARL